MRTSSHGREHAVDADQLFVAVIERVIERAAERAAERLVVVVEAAVNKLVDEQRARDAKAAAAHAAWMTTRQAADYLGLKQNTLEKQRLRGEGPKFHRLSRGIVRYSTHALDQYLEGTVQRSTMDERARTAPSTATNTSTPRTKSRRAGVMEDGQKTRAPPAS